MQQSLLRMAEREPELAGKMLVTALPAAAAPDRAASSTTGWSLDGVGTYDVSIDDGARSVVERTPTSANGANGSVRLRRCGPIPRTFARLAAGASPLRLMLTAGFASAASAAAR